MRTAILVALLSLPLLAQLPEGASTEIRLQEVKGEVEYQTAPKTAWKAAQVGDLLPVGTKICSGANSAAVLAFGTNSVAMIRDMSVLTINSYGMQGDQLVAQVMIDPGVCSVSVKQLAQFQTDFQVSTPRLTASVKGSGETITGNGGKGDKPDDAHVDDDFAEIVQQNGQSRGIAAGGGTDSNNAAPDDKALANNIIEVVSGLADSEQDPSQQSVVSQSTVIDAGSQTGSSNPVSNIVEPPAPQEPTFPSAQLTLTWGQNPADLDLHLFLPLQGGGRDEVSFTKQLSNDSLVSLTQDDTNGFGPEVINISQFTDGHYTAFVRIFSGTGDFASNPATVNVATLGGGQAVDITSNGVGQNWTVGEFNVVNGQATFNVIDTYGATPPNN